MGVGLYLWSSVDLLKPVTVIMSLTVLSQVLFVYTVTAASQVCYPSRVITGFVEYVTEMSQEMSRYYSLSRHSL